MAAPAPARPAPDPAAPARGREPTKPATKRRLRFRAPRKLKVTREGK